MPNLSNKIAHNVAWLTGAEMISRLLVFFAVVQLTNYLGDTAYGTLSYGFALANLVVVLADFGLSNYVVRELAQQVQSQTPTKELLVFKLGLSGLAVGAIMVIGVTTTTLSPLIILAGGTAIVLTNLRMFFEAIFRAQGRMWLEACTKIIHALLLVAIIMYCIMTQISVTGVALGYVLGAGVMSILCTILLITVTPLTRPWLKKPQLRLFGQTWPFALSLAMNALFNYLDSVMLGWFGPIEAVAWYTAAYKPIFFMTALAGMIINAFLPTIARHYQHNRDQIAHTVQQLLRSNLLLAMPLAVGGTLLAPEIIAWLYRPEYAPATLAFQILLWSTVGIYIWAVFGNTLQVCGHERDYMKNFAMALSVTVVGNIILIHYFSLYGAAVATLLTQVTLIAFMLRSYRQFGERIQITGAAIKIITAAGVMGVVLWWLPTSLPLWLKVAFGAITYGIVILSIRAVRITELKQLYAHK